MGKFILYTFVAFFKPLFWIFPHRLAFWFIWKLSRVLGFLLYISPLKKTIQNNIKLIYKFDDQKIKQLTKTYCYKISRYILEIFNLGSLTPKLIKQLIEPPEIKKLDQALANKQGAIILFMHCGNWELLSASLCLLGYPIHPVAKTPKDDLLIQFIDRNRRKNKGKVINTLTENFFRATLTALKNNEIPLIAADTGATESKRHIFFKFLDSQVPVASGWASVALKSQAPVFPIFLRTDVNKFKHQMVIYGPIETQGFNSEEDLLNFSLKFFEEYLLENPTEWFLPLSESETKKAFG